MLKALAQDARTALVAVVTASVVAAAPAAAAIVANADKVDGKHAVGYSATTTQRKGKLVATNGTTGRLPNNIIAKAPDANMLGGIGPRGYLRNQLGAVTSEQVQDGSLQRGDLSYDAKAAIPRAYGLVFHTGSLETSEPYFGLTSENVASPPDTQGVYCISGLGFSPASVSVSSSLYYSGPVTVHATLGQGTACAGVDGTQITVYTFAIQNASAYDGSFNIQIWGN